MYRSISPRRSLVPIAALLFLLTATVSILTFTGTGAVGNPSSVSLADSSVSAPAK